MQDLLKKLPLFILIAIIGACQSQVEQVKEVNSNKFEDPEIVRIYELIDRRDGDSLMTYLKDENETYRYEATLGFASIQDTSVLVPLAFNLNDSSSKVRKAAAYALGQTGDSSSIAPIIQALEVEDSVYVRKELLESLGKVITQETLKQLQYWPLKTQEDKEGLAWGLYRAGVRNIHDGISVDLALSLLDASNSYNTRLGAAHFLSRSRNLALKDRNAIIIRSAKSDVSENIRMACALALRNAEHPTSLTALQEIVLDTDYRVRVNALRALANYDLRSIQETLLSSLNDSSHHVAINAAGIISNKATIDESEMVQEALLAANHFRVKSTLFGTALKIAADKQSIIDQIIVEYDSATNSYYKAGLLSALGNTAMAQEFVVTKTFSEQTLAISSAGIGALASMRRSEDFPEELSNAFADIFKQAIETKDIAMIATAGSVITDPDLDFRKYYDSAAFLKQIRSELQLPKDMEAIQMLDRAISFFENTDYDAPQNEYNHPINWELVQSLGSNPMARVTTEKGTISMRLLIEDAPGSVANFAALARSGYYNGKNFHRVVPNFVIQGGCNRGDGYGGEDYSIRSEFANLKYEEGSVGMASAGKDTEGTQWFITHSPTPHLDGGYTIFAKVTEGMEVVHATEVGDKIISISIE